MDQPLGISSHAEVAFPLDSDHLLIMRDTRAPGGQQANDGSVEDLDDERVEVYNRMQVEQSWRQIYCRDDKFALASEMCAADPELTSPNARKVTIENIKGAKGVVRKRSRDTEEGVGEEPFVSTSSSPLLIT
jgi:hypothetical protein